MDYVRDALPSETSPAAAARAALAIKPVGANIYLLNLARRPLDARASVT
jgi:hypothetical protein